MTTSKEMAHEMETQRLLETGAWVGLPTVLALVSMERVGRAQIVSFDVKSESKLTGEQYYPSGISQLSEYTRSTDNVRSAIEIFKADFRSRFLKTRTVRVQDPDECSTVKDSKGNETEVCVKKYHEEDVPYWNIPDEVKNVIGGGDSGFLSKASDSLPYKSLPTTDELVKTINSKEPRSIRLEAKEDDPTARTILAGVSAAGVGTLYSLYDKLAGKLVEDWLPTLTRNINRRTFLKTAFLPVGARIASLVDDGSISNNQNLATELKDKISITITSVQARTKDQISADIFGVGVATTYQQLKALRNILNNLAIVAQTSRSNAVTGISTPALSLRGVVDQTITYIENNLPKSNDIPNLPPEALDTASSIVLTRELNNYTQAANRSSVLYPLVSAAASLGIFAAGAAGIEGVLKLTTRNKKD